MTIPQAFSLVDTPRLSKIIEFVYLTEKIEGDNAEVGVYRGGTSFVIANMSTKPLHLFDTFEGMPTPDKDLDLHKEKDFNDTSLESVQKLLKDFTFIEFYKGLFPKETSHHIETKKFSFVHLDCDLYKSVKESLAFFYPRMTKGGIIAIDDYNEPNCPGAKIAVDEFLKGKPEKLESFCQSQVAFIKA